MRFLSIYTSVSAIALLLGVSMSSLAGDVDIAYEKFQLDNGLTVLVHEDHKAPIVAVNLWYHIGSKDEKPGKTGFAHLFEHLMFNGSEHYDDEFFKPLRKVGATDMNGTTNQDRTNYFANVPSTAVEMLLWMESDRMGHLLGAITQEKLDEQRGVVQNEKRQGENQPYGRAFNLLLEQAYPFGHPYSWSPIGSMEDLNAASLQDVSEWFKQYYGPNNAVISLAGDITLAQARTLMQKYFGHIPASEPLIKKKAWIAKRSGEKRFVAYDRVPQARIYIQWNVPNTGHIDVESLDLAAYVLGGGKNSRLYKRLVYDDQIATSATVVNWSQELSGLFMIIVDVKPGVPLEKVEQALNQELATFLSKGPAKDELQRAKVSIRADFLRGAERIGGFGGKSDILAMGEVYEGNPGAYKTQLHRLQVASEASVKQVANRWLSDGRLVLEYWPYPEYSHTEQDVDRNAGVPDVNTMPDLSFPALQRTTLSNGLKVILAERHEVPVVEFQLFIDAGYAADQGGKLGTSSFTLSMMEEGTRKLDALEISAKLESLGATLSTGSDLDSSFVSLSALKENLSESLNLFADISLTPSFPQAEMDRLKARWMAEIQQEKARPMPMALRTIPPLLYGEGHAYAIPFTGSGTEVSIQSLNRKDLQQFHSQWFRPDNAYLLIVGDVTLKEITPTLEKVFGSWKAPSAPLLEKNIAHVDVPKKGRVFLINRSSSEQTIIIAGQVTPPENVPERVAIDEMNDIIGGNFTSRLNMNLREDKHWAYGAYSFIRSAKGQNPYFVYAPVQTDKTKESIQEIVKEFSAYMNSRPAEAAELQLAIDNGIRSLPGKYETASAVLKVINHIVKFNYSDNYVTQYKKLLEALTLSSIHKTTHVVLKPDRFTWVIVGDLSKIEKGIRELKLGEVIVIDADGKKLR